MLAGRDTTSVCSSFCCYLLAANPAKQKKVVNEIDKVIGKQMPTYDLLKKLVYTTAVVNESLRLYPPVPFDPKYSIEDDILPSGYKITTNTQLVWSAWCMGRLDFYWNKPEEFRPERWMGDNGGIPIKPYNFIPFQAGPRTCLGKQMAYQEVLTLLVLIYQRYTLTVAPTQRRPPKLAPGITLAPKNGINLIVHHRTDNVNMIVKHK
mmetsp:Transcript_7964/g.8784  ORF Transcript_7964/g.8784 Transcript_7964/m.8784 type:complete len:207 (-) Transcript_7964:91-711(-)